MCDDWGSSQSVYGINIYNPVRTPRFHYVSRNLSGWAGQLEQLFHGTEMNGMNGITT